MQSVQYLFHRRGKCETQQAASQDYNLRPKPPQLVQFTTERKKNSSLIAKSTRKSSTAWPACHVTTLCQEVSLMPVCGFLQWKFIFHANSSCHFFDLHNLEHCSLQYLAKAAAWHHVWQTSTRKMPRTASDHTDQVVDWRIVKVLCAEGRDLDGVPAVRYVVGMLHC
jgi:hypothetical protein